MTEKNIIPEEAVYIEPETVHIDFNKEELRKQVKTERMREIIYAAEAIYFQPDEKGTPMPEKHLIATAEWGHRKLNAYKKEIEGTEEFFPEGYKYREMYLRAKNKSLASLEAVDGDAVLQGVYRILSRGHEETHRMEYTRFGKLDMEDVLALAEEKNFEGKAELRKVVGNLDALLEAQARSTIYSKHPKVTSEQAVTFAEINLCSCAVFLAEVGEGVTLLKTIYDDIGSGDITPKDSKRYATVVSPHMLADIIIIAREPNLIEEVTRGDISYKELEAKVIEGLEMLLNKPKELITEITAKDFVIGVDQALQRYKSEYDALRAKVIAE